MAAALVLSSAHAQEPLRIGVPTSMTGPMASLGTEVKRAMEFAAAEANARGGVAGHKVELRFLDTESKPELARKQAERLALDGYKILSGTVVSGEALAIVPLLQRWDALFLSTINKSNRLTSDACVPRFFRVNRSDAQDAAAIGPWLATRKESRWAIMASDIAWGRESGQAFTAAAQAHGMKIVTEHYAALATNDYAPYIQRIRDSGADGLWVALAGRDAITFATQAKQYGLLERVATAGISFMTDANVKTLGDIAKGMSSIINYSWTLDNAENRRFVAAWRKAYGDTPANFEGEVYLGMQVLFQAVERARSVEPAAVAKAMSGASFDTILGKVTMRAADHQLMAPNHFGHIGVQDNKLRPIITTTIDAKDMPGPDASCKIDKG
jgi:branched-chain amino acid transport system substrate-binding protein